MSELLPRKLYLDNAATSFPKPSTVLPAMNRYATDLGASAGRGSYAPAVEAGEMILECRRRLNGLFNGEGEKQFIFTLNCSDALNLAIKGLVLHAMKSASRRIHTICTHIDHNSTLRPLNAMEELGWIEQTRVPIDPANGLLDPNDIRKAIGPDTKLIVITHASNVTGTLQHVREIGAIARERGVPLVLDAAQSAGHVPIDVRADLIDFLAAPGHKGLLGPLGTGVLYIRPGMEKILHPLREGGTGSVSEHDRQPDFMPDKYEPGSHNAIGIAGLNAGLEWISGQSIEKIRAHELDLIRTFIDGVGDVPGLRYFGPQGVRDRVGVFSMELDGYSPQELAMLLETRFGILARPGLHCAPLIHAALGTTRSGGTIRFSFGPFLSKQDIQYATDALASLAARAVHA
jgi:cysteine desulfurase family protein